MENKLKLTENREIIAGAKAKNNMVLGSKKKVHELERPLSQAL